VAFYSLRGHRSVDFERRSALYTRLDAQLYDRTRFFAAAALINVVLRQHFAVIPAVHSRASFAFLKEVGTALENANLQYARECGPCIPSRRTVDHALVRAEQRLFQCYVEAYRVHRPRQWEAIRSELNELLNYRRAALLFARWGKGVRCVSLVLREVRRDLGTTLDIATESHRIRIGMKLIELIRGESYECSDIRCRHSLTLFCRSLTFARSMARSCYISL
jgi:hypothetical protein